MMDSVDFKKAVGRYFSLWRQFDRLSKTDVEDEVSELEELRGLIQEQRSFSKHTGISIRLQRANILVCEALAVLHAETIQNKLLRRTYSEIAPFLDSFPKGRKNEYGLAWYLLELSILFASSDKKHLGEAGWSQIASFLKKNPKLCPDQLGQAFTGETLRKRVLRYKAFCAKKGRQQRIKYGRAITIGSRSKRPSK